MKWMQVIGTVILLITLMGCEENDIHAEYEKKLYKSKKQVEKQEKLPIELTESEARFLLDDLMALVDGHYSYDKLHRTVHMTIGEDEFYLIDDVPVIEKNGEYIPTEDIYLIIEKQHDESEKIYIPAEFIEVALQTSLQHEDGHAVCHWPTPAKRVGGTPPSFEMDQWGVEEMVSYLSFLQKPLQEAEVSTISGHLPGAPRPYRNGFHEGIDWYGY